MEYVEFFEPIDVSEFPSGDKYHESMLGNKIRVYKKEAAFPDMEGVKIAIIGVQDDRRAVGNKGCAQAPDHIRAYLYQLYRGETSVEIADLGNIKPGHTVEDTYYALSSVMYELIKSNVITIIVGGGQDLTFACYRAYENLGHTINIAAIDSSFDLGDAEDELTSKSYLSKIILHQPSFLFNYSNVGYQSYFADPQGVDLMTKLYFDVYRLGNVRADITEVEPIVRNADMLSFDITSIRQSDAPANASPSPNGFYGEEACQITRYAGMSNKLSSIGFFEVNPKFDKSGQTAHLTAQMIWYFIDGYVNRKEDNPLSNSKDYVKYRVSIKDNENEILFYKSNKTDRWWMDVPYPADQRYKFERHHLVPCSYSDYEIACKEEMPDRWWRTYQKLC